MGRLKVHPQTNCLVCDRRSKAVLCQTCRRKARDKMSDDEINGLVAFFVFGYKWTDVPPDYDGNNAGKTLAPEGCKTGFPPRGKVSPRYFCKQWSTDLKLAWEVVERVTGYVASNFALAKDNGCGAEFWNVSSTGEHRMGGHAHADTPARAICLAALNAVDRMRSKKC